MQNALGTDTERCKMRPSTSDASVNASTSSAVQREWVVEKPFLSGLCRLAQENPIPMNIQINRKHVVPFSVKVYLNLMIEIVTNKYTVQSLPINMATVYMPFCRSPRVTV